MAIKKLEELLSQAQAILGDNASDDAITLLEDISDTYKDMSERSTEDWKTKFETNDREWRERYKSRFTDGKAADTEDTVVVTDETAAAQEAMTYDKLFKED